MDEIVKEFLEESYESLDRLDRDLGSLEKDPHEEETLASIFRTIHTVKGTSGFLGYGELKAVAQVGENLLSKLRDGVIIFNPELASVLVATVDAGTRDYSELIALLARLHEGAAAPAKIPLAPTTALATAVAVPALRSHAAVDPQPVAVVAPSALPSSPALPAASSPMTSATVAAEIGNVWVKAFTLKCVKGGAAERDAFPSPELEFSADLSVNPWVDDCNHDAPPLLSKHLPTSESDVEALRA